jgi:hypothetical protein
MRILHMLTNRDHYSYWGPIIKIHDKVNKREVVLIATWNWGAAQHIKTALKTRYPVSASTDHQLIKHFMFCHHRHSGASYPLSMCCFASSATHGPSLFFMPSAFPRHQLFRDFYYKCCIRIYSSWGGGS